MKKILIILVMFVGINSSYAVGNSTKAKAKMESAKNAMTLKNYSRAANNTKDVIELLGSTNIELQVFLVKALYKAKRFGETFFQVERFLDLYPDESNKEYQNMLSIYSEVLDIVEDEVASASRNILAYVRKKKTYIVMYALKWDTPREILIDYRGWADDPLTPLHLAVEQGDVEMVRSFLTHPDIDVNAQRNSGFTILLTAVWKGHTEIINLLLGHRDINLQLESNSGLTPLSAALKQGFSRIAKILVDAGAVE